MRQTWLVPILQPLPARKNGSDTSSSRHPLPVPVRVCMMCDAVWDPTLSCPESGKSSTAIDCELTVVDRGYVLIIYTRGGAVVDRDSRARRLERA